MISWSRIDTILQSNTKNKNTWDRQKARIIPGNNLSNPLGKTALVEICSYVQAYIKGHLVGGLQSTGNVWTVIFFCCLFGRQCLAWKQFEACVFALSAADWLTNYLVLGNHQNIYRTDCSHLGSLVFLHNGR